jgi:hypothetical protein
LKQENGINEIDRLPKMCWILRSDLYVVSKAVDICKLYWYRNIEDKQVAVQQMKKKKNRQMKNIMWFCKRVKLGNVSD